MNLSISGKALSCVKTAWEAKLLGQQTLFIRQSFLLTPSMNLYNTEL